MKQCVKACFIYRPYIIRFNSPERESHTETNRANFKWLINQSNHMYLNLWIIDSFVRLKYVVQLNKKTMCHVRFNFRKCSQKQSTSNHMNNSFSKITIKPNITQKFQKISKIAITSHAFEVFSFNDIHWLTHSKYAISIRINNPWHLYSLTTTKKVEEEDKVLNIGVDELVFI